MLDQLVSILTMVGAVGAGLVGGMMLAFSTLVMGGLANLPAAQGIRAMQQINRGAYRPVFQLAFTGTALVAVVLAGQALFTLGEPGAWWRLAGAGSYLLTVLITGGFHIPRNKALDAMDPQSAAADDFRKRFLAQWIPANHLRVVTATAGCVLLIIAAQA